MNFEDLSLKLGFRIFFCKGFPEITWYSARQSGVSPQALGFLRNDPIKIDFVPVASDQSRNAFLSASSSPMNSSKSNKLPDPSNGVSLTIGDIYKLRLTLEPELAASLAGKLSEEVLLLLEANMEQYAYPAADLDEERAQHIASLRFHGILAEQADNPLLGFIVDFMVNLLSDLTVYRRLYSPPNIELWQQGLDHQRALIRALRIHAVIKVKERPGPQYPNRF